MKNKLVAALHIGINRYPRPYALSKCVADAKGFQRIFGGQLLLDGQCSPRALLTAIHRAVATPKSGEWAVITYSGHGTPVKDRNGDEPDGYDEAIVAVNLQPVIDDEIYQMLSYRNKGARILLIADSCYSGAVHRAMPVLSSGDLAKIKQQKIRQIPTSAAKYRRPTVANRGQQPALSGVTLISGCTDFEYSYEGPTNGVLTGNLLKTYEPGITMQGWFDSTNHLVQASGYPQHPQLVCGKAARSWLTPERG